MAPKKLWYIKIAVIPVINGILKTLPKIPEKRLLKWEMEICQNSSTAEID